MTQVSVIPFFFTSEAYTSLSASSQHPSHSCCVLSASLALSQIQQMISQIWSHHSGIFSGTNIYVLSLLQLPLHLNIFFFFFCILCCFYFMEKLYQTNIKLSWIQSLSKCGLVVLCTKAYIYKNFSLHLKFQEGNLQLHVYIFQLQSTGKTLKSTVRCFSVTLASSLEKAMAPYSSTLAWKIPW